MYVYSQVGVLINRVKFENVVAKFGNPICCSPNGQNYIFAKSEHDKETRKLMN